MDSSRLRGLQTSLPGRYAKALFEVALEQRETDLVLEGLEYFFKSMKTHDIKVPELLFLTPQQFEAVIEECVKHLKWPGYLGHFFKILHKSRRIDLLANIIDIFESLNDSHHNRLQVKLSVAAIPESEFKTQLESKITQLFGKEMRYEYEAIPSLLGGFIATVQESVQIDASVSSQLNQLHKILKDPTVKGAS